MPNAPSGVRTAWSWCSSPWMRVQVEVTVAPADEKPDREEDDQRRDGGLGALLHALGQELLEEEDRQPEQHEREGVTEAPERAEPRRGPARPAPRPRQRGSSLPRCDRGRSHAEGRGARRRGSRPGPRPRSRDWRWRRRVRTCGYSPPFLIGSDDAGSALTVSATPTPRITSALSAGSARTSGPRARRGRRRGVRDGDEADARDRRREAEAERGDQREAEADPMEGDRREQDDQRRGTGQQPGRDADSRGSLAR